MSISCTFLHVQKYLLYLCADYTISTQYLFSNKIPKLRPVTWSLNHYNLGCTLLLCLHVWSKHAGRMDCAPCGEARSNLPWHSFVRVLYTAWDITLKLSSNKGVKCPHGAWGHAGGSRCKVALLLMAMSFHG